MAASRRPRRRRPRRQRACRRRRLCRLKPVVKKVIVSATNVVVAVAAVVAVATASTARRLTVNHTTRRRMPPTPNMTWPTRPLKRRNWSGSRRCLIQRPPSWRQLTCRRTPVRWVNRVSTRRPTPPTTASGTLVVVGIVVAVAATGSATVKDVNRRSMPMLRLHKARRHPRLSCRPRPLPRCQRRSRRRPSPRRALVRRWLVTSAAAANGSRAARRSTSCVAPSRRWCRVTMRRAPAKRAPRRLNCSAVTASR